jgi:hypothetical protein
MTWSKGKQFKRRQGCLSYHNKYKKGEMYDEDYKKHEGEYHHSGSSG